MKKILLLLICSLIIICGCGKYDEKDVLKDLNHKVNKAKAYKASGVLEITNNDDTYSYDIEVSYKKDNFYKVSLTNQANDHTQVILKNKDGVYVLTPALNKSFKFQSDWPYDNSQIYLLGAIVNDLNKDEKKTYEKVDSNYIFKTKVNYPNNINLNKQKIIIDKKLNIKEVCVYNKNDVIAMKMTFKKIDYSPTFKDNYFQLDKIMETFEVTEESKSVFEEAIYPLVLPSGTKLTDEETIKKDDGERVIMTFEGEKSFVLVEESSSVFDEFTVIPTYGEPYRLMDTLGVMTDNSLSWSSNGIEYYLVSDVLSQNELVEIAQSIYSLPTMK